MKDIHVVVATFKNKISEEEIPYFRGSVIRHSGNSPLFHNHLENGFRYAYPLVQYKRIDGLAAIVGINEGGEAVKRLFEDRTHYGCQLGNRSVEMVLKDVRTEKIIVKCLEMEHVYAIKGWLPLNSTNYRQYLEADGLIGQVSMLEHILVGNILSFFKGIDLFSDFPIRCRILRLEQEKSCGYKNMELLSFSAHFRTNVSLPSYIGLGKSVAMNNGVITLIK